MKHELIFIVCLLCFFSCFEAQAQKAFAPEVLRSPKQYRTALEGKLEIVETPIFQRVAKENQVLLENGYAKYAFVNPDVWPPSQDQEVQATKVRVIFTKYPRDSAFWITDYKWLLSKRLSALFQLDSNLNREEIEYSILLQTDCDNEFEAMQLFHGIEITYASIAKESEPALEDDGKRIPNASSQEVAVRRILQFMNRSRYNMDSAVYNVFERNDQWKNALVVLDWTGSMYGHGAEAILWHALHEDSSYITQCAFFNDGDRAKNRKKIIGNTKGIYSVDVSPAIGAVKMMRKVQHRGNGGDSPENDLEALITSIQQAPSATDIVLIADNASCIRDFVLLQHINRPIHIVLCRTKNGINPQYINLARKTGGTLHFDGHDVSSTEIQMIDGTLNLKGVTYIVGPNNMVLPADRSAHTFAHCDRYYTYPKKVLRKKRRKEPECYFTD